MKLQNLNLTQLYSIREKLVESNENIDSLDDLIIEREISILKEDTSATGGPAGSSLSGGVGSSGVAYANSSISGMGSVVSPQPSMFAGTTVEPGYSAGGGQVGSGDISVPYNPGGRKKVFQKINMKTDDRRGTSKRRKSKIIKGLKNILSNKQDFTAGQSKGKILDFDKFTKSELSKVTRVSQ